jgi:hypothetical protein
MITTFLLGFESTHGLPFSLAVEQGTSFSLPFLVERILSNMCFKHSNNRTRRLSRMIAHEHLILLFSDI